MALSATPQEARAAPGRGPQPADGINSVVCSGLTKLEPGHGLPVQGDAFSPMIPAFLVSADLFFSIIKSPCPEQYRKDPEGSATRHLMLGGAGRLRDTTELAGLGLHTH